MRLIGLTGGIGSGKSAVSALLAERGAAVVDADAIAREVVVPGGPAYEPLVARFGPGILADDGTIDRPALAAVAFADAAAVADLNAITHPAIGLSMAQRLGALNARRDVDVAVAVIPLLEDRHIEGLGMAAVVVVDAPAEVAVARLVDQRGMSEADARARLAAQQSRQERLALADYVVDNSGSLEELSRQVDSLWRWIQALDSGRVG
jgi:dephospho-CoA kinase